MKLELVHNSDKYWEFIRTLRSNDEVQQGFGEQVHITREQQEIYMKRHNDEYFVCLYNDEPAGFIGVVDGDIRVAVVPAFQRRGVGLFMVHELMKQTPDCQAKVKIDNEASLKLFVKAGFRKKFFLLEKAR